MLESVGKSLVIHVRDVTVDYYVDSKESSSAAMDSLNQMTQAAIHQLDKTWRDMLPNDRQS